jgi:hypothetical protein
MCAWSGGSYTKGNNGTGGWAGDAALGIGIEAGRHDTQDNDFATGINQCINKDGSNAFTGNPNLGGYIPTNIGAGSAGAPAICPGNDVNTGMYSAGADFLAFAVNGVRRFYSTGGHTAIESNIASNFALSVINANTGANSYGLIIDQARSAFALAVRDNTNTYRHVWNADGSFSIGGNGSALNCNTSGDILINKTAANTTDAGSYFTKGGGATNPATLAFVKTVSGLVNGIVNYYAGTYVGGVDFSNTATSFPTSSDYRLKENVVPISNAVTRLNQLKPVRFNFIAEPDKTIDGFLAHEVATVVPNAVSGEKDAVNADGTIKVQALDHSKLIPLLVGALQELSTKVETLESQVEMLQTQVAIG